MKLRLEQICAITKGAQRVEDNGRICFHRFTQEQEELYLHEKPWHYYEVFYTAGVRLQFKTDSRKLYIRLFPSRRIEERQENMKDCVSGSYFALDVAVNGEYLDSLDNFSHAPLPEGYAEAAFETKVCEKSFSLGEGEKEVCIYLPWSADGQLEEISLDDGSYIRPVETSKKLLVFGDSITQGYDALHPSKHHIVRLTDALGAETRNKALGGSIFYPGIALCREDFEPDMILVACGTNDWSATTKEEFEANCEGFFQNLSHSYPHAKIIAITPLWRANYTDTTTCGAFTTIEEKIFAVSAELPNVTAVRGFDLIPHEPRLFGDGRLHPNDEGFGYYFENLYPYLK